MLKSSKIFISLGVVCLLAIIGYSVWFGLRIARSFDASVRIYNNLGTDADVTLLLQDHDNGGLYLTETRNFSAGVSKDEIIGSEKLRCVYVTTPSDSFSGYVTQEMIDDEMNTSYGTGIFLQTIFDRQDPCLRDMTSYGVGVKNRIDFPGKDY